MKTKFIAFGLFIISLISIKAQNPPDIKWKQINTKHYRIIFPQEIENYAKQTALIMDSIYTLDTKDFSKDYPPKIDLFLFNRSVISNAFAAVAPRRMQWYLTPPQSPAMSLTPWNKLLGIHEYRHVVQFSQMKKSTIKVTSWLTGDYGWAGLMGWAYPGWFFEGDAVFNETRFSNSGRGRMPAFALPLRAITLSHQKISYEKALFRSYKTYYPNHYYLGYYLVSYINRNYGTKIWDKIMTKTDFWSPIPYSFDFFIKKYTGHCPRKTYKLTFAELDTIWTKQLSVFDTTKADTVKTKRKKVWTNYYDMQFAGKDTLLAVKSGLDDYAAIVLLTKDKEKKIRDIPSTNISYRNGKVIWASYKQDIRFTEQSYSNIYLFDISSKKLTRLTNKGKYFSPEFSHSGDKIVASAFNPDLTPKIIIFDLDGKKIFEYKGMLNENFMMPTWSVSDTSIIFLKTSPKGEYLLSVNIKNKKTYTLLGPSWIKFDKPYAYKNYILFNYDYSGITNIYALNLKTKQIYLVISRPYSANQAIVSNDGYIYFTDYTPKGWQILKTKFDPSKWKKIQNVPQIPENYFISNKTSNDIQNLNIDFALKNTNNIKVTDYKPSKHLINVHSWLPLASYTGAGINIFSNDNLNTMSITASIFGDYKNDLLTSTISMNYKKYFPVFTLSLTNSYKKYIFITDTTNGTKSTFNSWQTKISPGIYIPLNFSEDNWAKWFYTGLNTSLSNIYGIPNEYIDSTDQKLKSIATFSFWIQSGARRYLAFRDIYPKLGVTLNAGYNIAPNWFGIYGFDAYTKVATYLPGPLKHHGIRLSASIEQRNSYGTGYYFGAETALPRGYPKYYFQKNISFSADYKFPLLYPDLNIPYFYYLKRIRFGLFADYSLTDFSGSGFSKITSYGAEINFDGNFFHIIYADATFGIRFAYVPTLDTWSIEPIIMDIPLDLNTNKNGRIKINN